MGIKLFLFHLGTKGVPEIAKISWCDSICRPYKTKNSLFNLLRVINERNIMSVNLD